MVPVLPKIERASPIFIVQIRMYPISPSLKRWSFQIQHIHDKDTLYHPSVIQSTESHSGSSASEERLTSAISSTTLNQFSAYLPVEEYHTINGQRERTREGNQLCILFQSTIFQINHRPLDYSSIFSMPVQSSSPLCKTNTSYLYLSMFSFFR